MGEISIKVTIAGRTYPLTIAKSEENNVRKAENRINELFKEYEANYTVKDKQDLLSMVALHFATRNFNLEAQSSEAKSGKQLDLKLDDLEQLLDKHLTNL